jgi:putative NADPH-quinone reductase
VQSRAGKLVGNWSQFRVDQTMRKKMKRICIIQGHPSTRAEHFCHALGQAYEKAALEAGHEVRRIDVAQLHFPLLREREDWEHDAPVSSIATAQSDIQWAQHVVIIYPMWLGALPALLKGFFEQLLRPGFAFKYEKAGSVQVLLGGRSARTITTMGMPGLIYRWWYRAHTLRSLERNVLRFVGIAPCRNTVIGLVEAMSAAKRKRWLEEIAQLGRSAS